RSLVAGERFAGLGHRIGAGVVEAGADPAMRGAGVVVGPRIVRTDGERLVVLTERAPPPRLAFAAVVHLVRSAVDVRVAERVPRAGVARIELDRALGGVCELLEELVQILV